MTEGSTNAYQTSIDKCTFRGGKMSSPNKIDCLFNPRNVVIIGASSNPKKVGYRIVDNIKISGFKGKVYPINLKGDDVLGYKAYTNIADIKDESEIDMVLIAVPSRFVFDAVKTCASKNVKYLLIITSGFSEIGKREEEREIVDFAKQNGMRVLGPNIFGLFSHKASLNASFAASHIPKGSVALVSQSGALGSALIGETAEANIGLSAIVPLGNKADLVESELLEYLADDEYTKVIFIYMESVTGGSQLIKNLKKASLKKPVIIIKSGRSVRGAKAAASHTGSLSGSDEIFQAISKQCGVHRPENIVEALQWSKFLATSPMPTGENSIIITNGGGVGVMAADACEKFGVALYDNQKVLHDTFSDIVPEFGSCKNPIDITGQVGIEGYEKCIERAMLHPDIHSVICLGCEHALFNETALKDTISRIHKKYGQTKPIAYVFYGGKSIKNAIRYLQGKDIPIFNDVYEAASCLGEIHKDFRYRQSYLLKSEIDLSNYKIDTFKIEKVINEVKKDNRNFLLSDEASEVMAAVGITMPKSSIAKSENEAKKFAKETGYPVVMKISSKDIIHKSDAGGVFVNIKNESELLKKYTLILKNAKNYNKDALIKGVEIVEMVSLDVEAIVGGQNDDSFGPTLMFGSGGIYVEVLKDVSFRALTFSNQEIDSMIKETKLFPLLNGVRGQSKKDIAAVKDAIVRIGLILKNFKEITDIEINPLVAYDEGKGVKAVDVRILID